ncbi:mandelate racemase/muconate lactonizing enzyme family protein [bacterium]|nr:MAG: mandelate racemase/muconate lactonizing enzyme family protein [bacterium]
MKITAIETIVLSIPYTNGGPPTAFVGGSAWTSLQMLLVRVDTDAGISGWGEPFGHNACHALKQTIDTMIAPLCIGRDADRIGELMASLQHSLHLFGHGNGLVAYGLSALDIALWDIAGKQANLPLYRMLGGSGRRRVPAYASLLRYGDPELVARNVAAALERGYREIKLHEIAVAQVKAARAAAGEGVPLMLDTNCPWTSEQAREMARRLGAYDLAWLEEPIFPPEDFAALAELRKEAPMKLAAGENASWAGEFKCMLDARAVDVVQPSVTKVGGISEMQKVLALAEAYNATVVPHCAYFGPGFLATLHLTAVLPAETIFERLYMDLEASPYGQATAAVDGYVAVPQGPGLGHDPDPEVIERYRVHGAAAVTAS